MDLDAAADWNFEDACTNDVVASFTTSRVPIKPPAAHQADKGQSYPISQVIVIYGQLSSID